MGMILVVEFDDTNNSVFEEIIQLPHCSSGFSKLSLEDKSIMSVPGLEINTQQRKVYCGNQEIHFTVKVFDILCLLITNKEQIVTYQHIYIRV